MFPGQIKSFTVKKNHGYNGWRDYVLQTNTLLLNEFLGESNRLLYPCPFFVISKGKKGIGCFSEKSKDTSFYYSIKNY